MIPALSVIICAHNPRAHYFERVLNALRTQTLSLSRWELILIDNLSEPPIASRVDLSWHPAARCIVEPALGLTLARLRGIRESRGPLLLFVDDDNVLAPTYLELALETSLERPYLGAFSGSAIGEFEVAPQPWITPYLSWLAIRKVERDNWSNLLSRNVSTPFGAGLCVTRPVAEDYLDKARLSAKRRGLDRVGHGMGSAGDTDLAYCAIDLGLGIGTFARLELLHLIPKERLTVDYIARLGVGIHGSEEVLKGLRPVAEVKAVEGRFSSLRYWLKLALSSKIDRKIELAARAGRLKGKKFLRESAADPALIQA